MPKRTKRRSIKIFSLSCLLGLAGGVCLLAVSFPSPARAVLGGLRPEVMAQARTLKMSLIRTDQRPGYTALTFQRSEQPTVPGRPPRTLTVREFLDSGGRSFAVAWKGSLHPDLSLLLGSLYRHLPPVIRSPDRHRLFFQDGRLAISVVGNAHFQIGSAWDRTRLPQGVTPDRIRIAP